MKNLYKDTRGVTIMELLVVVAIIGILTLLTLPNIPAIIAGHRFRTANNDLMAKLRAVRALAITKGRTLELTMDLDNQSFIVEKLEHKEYNVLDEDETTNKDLMETLVDEEDISSFVLFTEERDKIHLIPRWDRATGEPIYDVPINYDITSAGGDHRNGVETVTMTRISDGSDVTTITFYPSGTVKENVQITLEAPPKYPGEYNIYVYRAGQIRGKI